MVTYSAILGLLKLKSDRFIYVRLRLRLYIFIGQLRTCQTLSLSKEILNHSIRFLRQSSHPIRYLLELLSFVEKVACSKSDMKEVEVEVVLTG